ncbi:DUF488 domain-containing protein [Asanoa siamensis]|uniref:DUF488 domain-containing protein n=1 Tax=Asanoa siamensis TaxID=926357 RepID=A0ABQ4CI92_9ACTN|nr:DUF488 domain-containing protein [Asanoa siamensis]GIF71010.1 hypothetical protein Asi02nite_05280 [Asanoa siamensis]
MNIVGIGYEGLTLPDFLSRLRSLDASAGLGYTHVPALGNPPWNQAGFRSPDAASARAAYADLMPMSALTEVALLASHERIALLCFEADQSHCHRDVILSALT